MTIKTMKSASTDIASVVTASLPGTKSRWYGRASITISLATTIGLLVLIAVGSVLGVGVWLAQKNTFSLLSANADQAISATVNRIKQHLRPAEHQAKFLAQRIEKSEVNPVNRRDFGHMLVGALAAAPQVQAVVFIDTKLQSFRAGRSGESDTVTLNEVG